jgi:hypothetical protein
MNQSFISIIKKTPWSALLVAWLIIMTGSWMADGLKGDQLFATWLPPALAKCQWLIILFAFVVFISASIWLYHHRQAFSLARSLSRHLCEPHSSLILLVSPSNISLPTTSPLFPLYLGLDNGMSIELRGTSLTADIQALDQIRWNWQQILRALVPHSAKLRRLRLIGSPEPRGSFLQLDLCKAILERYLSGVTILPVDEPIDFENFNALVQCMRRIIKEEEHHGMKEQEIIIDVTGGFKTTSIAGASITFNSQVTFQYVQTQPPNEVYAYDVIYQSPFAIEG